jgi:hypothetical protein
MRAEIAIAVGFLLVLSLLLETLEHGFPTVCEIEAQQALERKSRIEPVNGDSIMVGANGFSNHRFRRRR